MPKRVTETELQKIEDVLLRHPAGLSLRQLQSELGGAVSRRTLSRRISALLLASRIHRRGEGRLTRYVHGSAWAAQDPQLLGRKRRPSGANPTAIARGPKPE